MKNECIKCGGCGHNKFCSLGYCLKCGAKIPSFRSISEEIRYDEGFTREAVNKAPQTGDR